MSTDRNPFPKLTMGYEIKGTPGCRKIQKHEGSVQKRKLNDSNDQFEQHDDLEKIQIHSSPEASCSHSVPTTTCTATQYDKLTLLYAMTIHILQNGRTFRINFRRQNLF